MAPVGGETGGEGKEVRPIVALDGSVDGLGVSSTNVGCVEGGGVPTGVDVGPMGLQVDMKSLKQAHSRYSPGALS